MHAGNLYDFSDDEVTRKWLHKIIKMFGRKDSTHEIRMAILGPMLLKCSEKMQPSVEAIIGESECRGYYMMCKKFGVSP